MADLSNGDLLAQFEADTARGRSSGPRTLRGRLHAALRRHELAHGWTPHLLDCLTDADILAQVLRCDRALDGSERTVSRQTVQNTIYALRALAAWVPLPPDVERSQLRACVEGAVSLVAVRRGTRRILDVGVKRRETRVAPTPETIVALIAHLEAGAHPLAPVVAELVGTAYLTGVRIGALLKLRRVDLRREFGRWCFVVDEKSRPDRRPVLARVTEPRVLERWLTLPPDGALWQRDGQVLRAAVARRLLAAAVAALGLPDPLTFHSLRHAFASDLAQLGDLELPQRAGGWRGELVVQSYIHPR